MQPPALPDDEILRLRTLHECALLDTAPDLRFDRLTRLAQHLFGTPIVLVSLVDSERQWFKSRQGYEVCETPRDISFCGHAILGSDIFEITDALLDPRFADNPLVTGPPNIRFYAGAPLSSRDGHRIGTLCIIAGQPRLLTAAERESLRHLAACVEEVIEQRWHETNRLMADVLENVPNMIFLKRATDLRFELFNRAGETLLGRSRTELLGRNDYDFFPKEQADFFIAKDREVLAQDGVVDIPEEVIETPHGTRLLYTRKLALRDAAGRPQYLLGISEDITERRRVERMKSELISTVSHELRTPLTTISGVLGLLGGGVLGALPEQAQELVGLAEQNAQRLTCLIDDLLDMERLMAGKQRFDMQAQPLMPLVAQAIRDSHAYADRHKVCLRLVERADVAVVEVDAQRLQQVLANLLSNAAKFSPEGGEVEVTVEARDGVARVTVRDHGPGIPADFHERIFEKFSQADASDSRQKGGSGLGLAISRELIERMGGRIDFESVEGEGASFFFELPLVPQT